MAHRLGTGCGHRVRRMTWDRGERPVVPRGRRSIVLGRETNAHAVLTAVSRWFVFAFTASMELPDGWFGRPYDNMHCMR